MFKILYNGYKINPMDITPKNDKESLKLYVDAMCFAAHDINLLLLLISYATGRIYIIEDYV